MGNNDSLQKLLPLINFVKETVTRECQTGCIRWTMQGSLKRTSQHRRESDTIVEQVGGFVNIVLMVVRAAQKCYTNEGRLKKDSKAAKLKLIGWLQTGKVVFDRHGKIGQAQAKVKAGVWLQTNNDQETYGAWQSINYNLQVVRRYLAADDPAYLAAAEIRMMLFGPQDLFFNYFAVRGLPPASEKKAIQYLQSYDPEYLQLFNRFLAEQDRHVKYQLYEELAALTLAPVGALWQTGETILNLGTQIVTPALE